MPTQCTCKAGQSLRIVNVLIAVLVAVLRWNASIAGQKNVQVGVAMQKKRFRTEYSSPSFSLVFCKLRFLFWTWISIVNPC